MKKGTKVAEPVAVGQNPKKILKQIWEILRSDGYDPTTQMSGFLLTGDPTYLPVKARPLVTGVYHGDLIDELVRTYFHS